MAWIETVPDSDFDDLLARVLAPTDAPLRASRAHIRTFKQYMTTCSLHWAAWRCKRHRRVSACVFVLFLPGKTAIAMFPLPGRYAHEREDLQLLLEHVVTCLAGNRLHYLQALVEPRAAAKHDLLQEIGFRHLTQLIYMQRPTAAASAEVCSETEASWISYDDRRHSAFAHVLATTYIDSCDCPELSGTRPIDDVIASHKAAGVFNPSLWEIAAIDGEYAGCVLLSPLSHGSMVEVVYMGVTPNWRRKGVGWLLLRRALEKARLLGVSELTTVVDCRNAPARQLYVRFGFIPTERREAYLYSWHNEGVEIVMAPK